MEKFIQISPNELTFNPFTQAKQGALILAGDEKKSNAMLVDSLLFGRAWEKDLVGMCIKPLRYTKEFVDLNSTFSINIFDEKYKADMEYLGSCSGRNVNKMSKSELEYSFYRGTPFFQDAHTIIFCNKIFAEELEEFSFINKDLLNKFYVFKDFHTIYLGEIDRVLISQ